MIPGDVSVTASSFPHGCSYVLWDQTHKVGSAGGPGSLGSLGIMSHGVVFSHSHPAPTPSAVWPFQVSLSHPRQDKSVPEFH